MEGSVSMRGDMFGDESHEELQLSYEDFCVNVAFSITPAGLEEEK